MKYITPHCPICSETKKDAIELIKIKDMLSSLEKATDMAEDVSDVLKSIIVKTS